MTKQGKRLARDIERYLAFVMIARKPPSALELVRRDSAGLSSVPLDWSRVAR